jgi:hypothetical protein
LATGDATGTFAKEAIKVNNMTMTISDAVRVYGISHGTLRSRLKRMGVYVERHPQRFEMTDEIHKIFSIKPKKGQRLMEKVRYALPVVAEEKKKWCRVNRASLRIVNGALGHQNQSQLCAYTWKEVGEAIGNSGVTAQTLFRQALAKLHAAIKDVKAPAGMKATAVMDALRDDYMRRQKESEKKENDSDSIGL